MLPRREHRRIGLCELGTRFDDAGSGCWRWTTESIGFSRCFLPDTLQRAQCLRALCSGGLMPAVGWALFILRLLGTVYLLHFQSRVVYTYSRTPSVIFGGTIRDYVQYCASSRVLIGRL